MKSSIAALHVIHNHPYFSWYVDYLHMHINVCAGACAACFIGTVNVFLSGVCVCVSEGSRIFVST